MFKGVLPIRRWQAEVLSFQDSQVVFGQVRHNRYTLKWDVLDMTDTSEVLLGSFKTSAEAVNALEAHFAVKDRQAQQSNSVHG